MRRMIQPVAGKKTRDAVREIHPAAQAVHRLDLGTSGVLVVATRRKAETILRQQFQNRLTRKLYLARVQGVMSEDSGRSCAVRPGRRSRVARPLAPIDVGANDVGHAHLLAADRESSHRVHP